MYYSKEIKEHPIYVSYLKQRFKTPDLYLLLPFDNEFEVKQTNKKNTTSKQHIERESGGVSVLFMNCYIFRQYLFLFFNNLFYCAPNTRQLFILS